MFKNFVDDRRAAGLPGAIGLAVAAALFASADASAIPFNSNVSISASVDLDALSTTAPAGLTQSGTFFSVVGGVSTSSAVDSGLAVTGTLPVGGALTDVNDGVGMNFSGSGSSTGGTGSSDLFGNYLLTLTNSSATDTFKVTLGLEFTNQVDANGPDAAIEGEIFLVNGATQFFFSNLISDTLLGDQGGGTTGGDDPNAPLPDLGTNGNPLSDSGTLFFDFTLAPGQTVNLTGEHNMFADLFNGSYSATVNSRVFVSGVENQTTPPPPTTVPEPAGLWLLGAGWMGLRATRRTCQTN